MKIIVEIDIKPSLDNPDVELNPESVTQRLRRRILNADLNELKLDYDDPKSKEKVWFLSSKKTFTAVEQI